MGGEVERDGLELGERSSVNLFPGARRERCAEERLPGRRFGHVAHWCALRLCAVQDQDDVFLIIPTNLGTVWPV